MFKVSGSFMGSFKTGDNINYNLKCLRVLYQLAATLSTADEPYINKPITLLNVAIIEAVLHDFHMRMRTYTREGVANIAPEILSSIRTKKIDELEKYIASARKNDFFEMADTDFYETLDLLRKTRNRIHIQNANSQLSADETNVYTLKKRQLSERALEKVLKTMQRKYLRGYHSVTDFELPWKPWFDEDGLVSVPPF